VATLSPLSAAELYNGPPLLDPLHNDGGPMYQRRVSAVYPSCAVHKRAGA